MVRLKTVLGRLQALWRAEKIQTEIDEELRCHIDMRTENNVRNGMGPEEAKREAEQRFGQYRRIRELGYEVRGGGLLEALANDVRISFRTLLKKPSFTLIAIVTLGLGVAASTTILSVANSILLHPLPFPDAGRLVMLFATTPERGVFRDTTSFPDFRDWQAESHAFTHVAAYRTDPFNVTGGGEPERVIGVRASHELFGVLGVDPVIGRSFDRKEQEEKSPLALISHGLWLHRFGGVPEVLGKTIVLNDVSHSIIGVLPEGFQFPPFVDIDILVPILERPSRSTGYIRGIARLQSGVSVAKAQNELDTIAKRLEEAFPLSNRGRGINVVPLREVALGDVRTPLVVLLVAALFVLLIGCANVGGLTLARNIARRQEFALRAALGAGGGRLVRQLLTESVVMTLLSTVFGTGLALLGRQILIASLSQRFVLPRIAFEWTILLVGITIALLASVLCGIPTAILVWRSDLEKGLRQGGRSRSSGPDTYRVRSVLVIAQTALTIVLLVGAGLLLKSFMLMQQVPLGFDAQRVLTAELVLSKRYEGFEGRRNFLKELLDSIRDLPGIQQVAVATDLPYDGGSRETFTVEGQADPGPGQGHPAGFNVVSGGYFAALNIAIDRGRSFDQKDGVADTDLVIVNETMARQFWPNQDAIGKRLRFYYDEKPQHWLSVVGVAGDVRDLSPEDKPKPQVYVSYRQPPHRFRANAPAPVFALVVRTVAEPTAMVNQIRKWVWAVDKDQTVTNARTMQQALSRTVADRRLYLVLVGGFALIALIVATAGIYGLVSYAAASRTQEIGIRVALGARSGQILAMVLRQGMILLSIGTGIGIVASFLFTKALSGLLFGITPTDPATFIVVISLFTAAAVLAMYIPARRAAMIDPTVAFRYE